MKNKFKALNGFVLAIIFISFSGCGSDGGGDYPSFNSDELAEDSVIEAYHHEYFHSKSVEESKDNPAIYVDFSDGITQQALKDKNNLGVFKMLIKGLSTEENTEYYELSSDSMIRYEGSENLSYFTKHGHTDQGAFKIGAPIDQAINTIVERDNVGMLITDGELYNKEEQKVSSEAWASKALEKWLNKGHELVIVYTDFVEKHNGIGHDKHMYVMFFIPNNKTLILDNYISDLEEEGLEYKKLSFSTNTKDLFSRDYPNAQLPGAPTYLEYFGEPMAYLSSENSAMEFIDMTNASFNCYEDGLVHYLRDLGNPNTGKPQNYPLFDKLYFEFSSLPNYEVNSVKIVVHDVYEDLENYKRNVLARNNPPVLEKDSKGEDSLADGNHLVFNGMSWVDGEEPYDTSKVTVNDKTDGFISILKDEFKYTKTKFSTSDKGIQDFLIIDQIAGETSEINQDGKYEIIIKLDSRLNEDNAFLNTSRQNLFRIDVILDDVNTKEISKEALTWKRIDDGEQDDALYRSLKNIMKKENVKPNGVVYSYYVKLGKFNDQ
jgi:hypothetical protein